MVRQITETFFGFDQPDVWVAGVEYRGEIRAEATDGDRDTTRGASGGPSETSATPRATTGSSGTPPTTSVSTSTSSTTWTSSARALSTRPRLLRPTCSHRCRNRGFRCVEHLSDQASSTPEPCTRHRDPRRGRRIGRMLLNARGAAARRRAIAKLDERDHLPVTQIVDAVHVTIFRSPPPDRRRSLEMLGHHLQRAAAENA